MKKFPHFGRTAVHTFGMPLHADGKRMVFYLDRFNGVACGGTIWQDISLIPGKTLDHMQRSASRSEVSHRIRTERGSRLREYVGSSLFVNSFHHQAVNSPGKNVTVSARAQDDTIEAIEIKDHPFAIGVQWHPECMYRSSSEMRKLFHEFVLHSLIN